MTERELRERLRAVPVAKDPEAEERVWRAVQAAHRPPGDRPTQAGRRSAGLRGHHGHPRRRLVVPALGCVAVTAAVALGAGGAPRAAFARWVGTALGLTAQPRPRPILAGLPSGGRLLVNAPGGPWIVGVGGVRHRLGTYDGAAWSPHSLYVVAWHQRHLVTLNPQGKLQWDLLAGARVSTARWSPDGYRITYLAGASLDVVAGDGSGAHRVLAPVRAVAPAWQPRDGSLHRLAFVDRGGAVQVRDADSGALVWRARPSAAPEQLLWTPAGDRLLVISRRNVAAYGAGGRPVVRRVLSADEVAGAAAVGLSGQLAMVIHRRRGQLDSVELSATTATGLTEPRLVFTAAQRLSGLAWSPDGRWLLVESPSADEWIFLRVAVPARISAVSQITAKFAGGADHGSGFPALGGWQP